MHGYLPFAVAWSHLHIEGFLDGRDVLTVFQANFKNGFNGLSNIMVHLIKGLALGRAAKLKALAPVAALFRFMNENSEGLHPFRVTQETVP